MQSSVNNDIYDTLGERWYSAQNDPVALLRAQNETTGPWIVEKLSSRFGLGNSCKVLDIGCGGGFLSNRLAKIGHTVTGIDLSHDSLEVAKRFDVTRTVQYQPADACKLPFPDNSFDAVTAMDFLEHVERPDLVFQEAARVLRPGGLVFFHTFNRNALAGLVIIKFVEWFVPNTPKNMHILRLFITPDEIQKYCAQAGLKVQTLVGTRPQFWSSAIFKLLFTRNVPKNFRFRLTNSLLLSYLGSAEKS